MTMSVQEYLAPEQRPAGVEKQIYLHPGHISFTTEHAVISTVLGSCVSVCLFDEEHTAAGMNHYLLPERAARGDLARFGDSANELLLERFLKIGVPLPRLRAKVFGGASMGGPRAGNLPGRNVDVAVDFLRSKGIPLVSRDTGGVRGRKLIFRTCDATAWVRLL